MLGGYAGKILWVNLTEEKCESIMLEEEFCRKYIGGVGFAAKILWDETTSNTKAFSPDNPLLFMVGPVTGTMVPSNSRYVAASISPLTNIFGQAHGGGAWAYMLKHAGFDGIVIKGKAKHPVYLWIHDDQAEIINASHLWGKNTWETDDLIKEETDQKASVITIGQAGENLVRYACIVGEGKYGRVAARCGLGAVMGSKRLKAIAVLGTQKPTVYDTKGLKEHLRRDFVYKHLDDKTLKANWGQFVSRMWDEGKIPIKNYQSGSFTGEKKYREKWIKEMTRMDRYYCKGCSVGCIESKRVGNKRHQTGEALLCMGTRFLIDDMDALQEAYDRCNQYGIECMSLGGVLAFVMELFEKGLMTEKDTDGVQFRYGDTKLLFDLIEKVAYRDGFGRLLGEGVKRIADHMGGLAHEYAMHVKGHEFPLYDVRAWNAGTLEFATASTGAHHYEGLTLAATLIGPDFLEGIGSEEVLTNRFAIQGVGKLTAGAQDLGNMLDSLVICKMLGGATSTGQAIRLPQYVKWLNYVTGLALDLEEFMKTGERIFNLKRLINVRRGISRKDDTVPLRFLTQKRGSGQGGTAENLPPLGIMLNEYYECRGWGEEGIPKNSKIKELDLEELVKEKSDKRIPFA